MATADELLHGPLLKLERARHHINDLNGRIEALLADRPFKLMERINRKAGKRTYFVKKEQSIPPLFSLIIGDAVHNLRTALDLTLYALAGDVHPKIHFPFPDKPEGLKKAIRQGHVKAAGEKVVDAICNLQPYPGGDGTPLHTIHSLDIQDKHHLLILSAQRATFTTGDGSEAFLKPFLRKSLPEGVTVVLGGAENEDLLHVTGERFVLRELPDTVKEAKIQPTFIISFGESETLSGFSVIQVLTVSAEKTEFAVRAMVDAFLDPGNKRP